MRNRALILLTTTALLSACADEAARRDYLYKPAYCLASGLAALSNEECMPQKLKDEAAATAAAKIAAPAAPAVAKHVYYTEDQRLAMGLDVAETMFEPNEKLTRSSVTVSLEANELIQPADKKVCGRNKTRSDSIDYIAAQITPAAINRETAKFLSEHYSDLQLSELYRVAKQNGNLADVSDDAFIIPDPKDAKKTVNIKPQAGRSMGSIISFTTSRTVSQLISKQRKPIDAALADIAARNQAELCTPKPEPVAAAPAAAPEAPAAQAATAVAAPAPAAETPAVAEGAKQ